MFFNNVILGRKGPLARVWLAAHWDKKITKAQILETNIVETVDSILQPRVKLSLRTTSHLLMGIVRIYSRKTMYLLQDCQDAAFKIKSAFRPGAVDLPDGKTEAAISAITLPEMLDFVNDFDLIPDQPIQIETIQTNANIRSITLVEDVSSMQIDDPLLGEARDWQEYSSIPCASTSKDNLDDSQLDVNRSFNKTSHPLDIFDRPPIDDGFGAPLGIGDVDDMFAIPMPPEAQEQMEAENAKQAEEEASQAKESANGDGERPDSRMSDDSVMSFGAPDSIPSGPSTPASNGGLIGANDIDMEDLMPNVDQQQGELPVLDNIIDKEQDNGLFQNENHIFAKPAEAVAGTQESMVLEPLDAATLERKRKRRKKLGIIIDDVKTLSGEEMKAQLADTSDIVTTLDLAPMSKKLMLWKKTGGSEKLFALAERPLPSKTLLMYYTRHLVTNRIQVEEEIPEDSMNGEIIRRSRRPKYPDETDEDLRQNDNTMSIIQPDISDIPIEDPSIINPIETPLKEIQPTRVPRTPRREPLADKVDKPSKKKRKITDEQSQPEKSSRSKQRAIETERSSPMPPPPPPSHSIINNDNHFNSSSLEFDSLRAGSTNQNWTMNNFQQSDLETQEDEEQYHDTFEQPLSVGPPEEMMPDETAEQYEERMRNKRSNVLLRFMAQQLEEGSVEFSRLVKNNRRKQVAQKFYSLLVLKKQQAIELLQDHFEDYSNGEIHISKGYRYEEAVAAL